MDLLQVFASNLWALLLVVVFFGGSIFVHELGHFLAARRRGVHVERFSIGFGPPIFSWHGRDGVEYRLSWLPLGGYVALPQLADMAAIEGESRTDLSKLPPPSYATKMIVFAAGAFFNILFAIVLACIIWGVGQPSSTLVTTTEIGYVQPTLELPDKTIVPGPAFEAGLKPGDTITAIDGKPISDWLDLQQTLATGSGRAADGRPEAIFSILRDGHPLDLTVHPRLAGEEGFRSVGIEGAEDLSVDEIMPDSAAAATDLRHGDRIVAVDGHPVFRRGDVSEFIQTAGAHPVTLEIAHAGAHRSVTLTPRLEDIGQGEKRYLIGVRYTDLYILLHPTPFEQIREHVRGTWRVLTGLVNPHSDLGPSKLSGPVGIARGFHSFAKADIRLVLWFTILVNVNLAIFNLLPIPVLDGGQMLFATIARLRGRALPFNFIATTQSVFMVLLFSMILYVSFFDVRRWVRDSSEDQAESPAPASAPVRP